MKIFVYGTLRPSLYPQRKPRNVTVVNKATLEGFTMWNLGRFPALTQKYNYVQGQDEAKVPSAKIVGEVYDIPQVSVFDGYEGYKADGTGLYDRDIMPCVLETGERVMAWVYFMHTWKLREVGGAATIVQSGDWADVMPKEVR